MPLHRRLSDQAIGNNKQIQRNATQRKSSNTRLKSDSHDMILLAISQLRHIAPKPPACLFCRTSDVAAAKSPHAKFINTNRSSDGCSGYRLTQARDRGDRSNKQSLGPSVLTRLQCSSRSTKSNVKRHTDWPLSKHITINTDLTIILKCSNGCHSKRAPANLLATRADNSTTALERLNMGTIEIKSKCTNKKVEKIKKKNGHGQIYVRR